MLFTARHGNIWRRAGVIHLLAAITLGAGCATLSVPPAPAVAKPLPVTASLPPKPIPIVRYGRYTSVDLKTDTAQEDLLQQIVNISIPGTMSATVGDALRYLLLRSGYQLCEGRDAVGTLYGLPLPAAHLHLGPLFLHDALQTLAGPAWELQVDDLLRQVCFTRRANLPATPEPTPMPSTTDASARPEDSAKTFGWPEARP